MTSRVTRTGTALVLGLTSAAAAQTPQPTAPAPRPAPSNTVASAPASRLLLEVVGSIGTTVVDVDQWAGATATDWNTTAYGGMARLFFLPLGKARVGVEVGYQYLLWWSVDVPGQSYDYTYESAGSRISGVIRWPLGSRTALDAGIGAQDFESESNLGVHLAGGYHLPLNPRLVLPMQVRMDYLFNDPAPIVITLHVGLGFRL